MSTRVINKQTCICTCGHKHTVSQREIALYRGMVTALFSVMRWCEQTGRHEFQMSEIRHLLDKNEYARWGDWKMFGGLVYTPYKTEENKAHYGLNIPRCKSFFAGEITIPSRIYKNPVTGELTPADPKHITQIPHLGDFLNKNNQYIAVYRSPQPALL